MVGIQFRERVRHVGTPALAGLIGLGCLLGLASCGGGGGSSGAGGSGGLNFRALWQSSGGGAARAISSVRSGQTECTGFGSSIPSSVRTVRISFDSSAGQSCCLAIAPGDVPIDSTGHGALVLGTLPGGLATVVIAGFATDFAPAPPGITQLCDTSPAGVAQPCDTNRDADPNFLSDPHSVTIQPGVITDAGDICVAAVGTATPTSTPGRTSTPTPTPTSPSTPPPTTSPTTIIVSAGQNIAAVAKQAPAGSTIIVSPGLYGPVNLQPGDLQGPLDFFADVNAEFSESAPAPVTIRASGAAAALTLSGQTDLVFDGFTFRSGTQAVVLMQNSAGITLGNCEITGSAGSGVRLLASSQTLIFDNLIFNNAASGIFAAGSSALQVINNTVYNNGSSGMSAQDGEGIFVENNIFDQNTPQGLVIDATALSGFQGDYNLNRDGYGPGTPIGPHDVAGPVGNPLFISPGSEDFHLAKGIAGSVSPAIDAGDPATDADLASLLAARTTQTDGSLDTGRLDLGYHYLPPITTPTPGAALGFE
jgi:parallel beta-helix repeat protein